MARKVMVILDAGHGNNTPGKRSPKMDNLSQLFEYRYNRDIQARIVCKLAAKDIPFHVLVPELHDISLAERCKRVNDLKAPEGHDKLFISIHANAAGNGTEWHTAEGFEVFTTVGETKADKFATLMYEALKKNFPDNKFRKDFTDGDIDKESNFYILKNTSCPAVLTENGFYTNKAEATKMLTDKWQELVADAHVQAIEAYLKS